MKRLLQASIITSIAFVVVACGAKGNEKSALTEKKASLEKLKQEQTKIATDIKKLENEIAVLDSSANNKTVKLVDVITTETSDFFHYIDLQGKIDADNISYVAPRGTPGQVKSLFIKKGDYVKAGQLLLKLDDAIYKQQIQNTNTQLALAKDIYRRQKNLWDQGIGTEVQLISAKNNVDQLENAIKLQKEQLSMTNVYAKVNGYADQVNVRVGEFFQGFIGNMPQIQIVNTSSLKVVTDIPENYINRVKKGSSVKIILPDLNNKEIKSTITLISQSINANSRGFIVEAKIPYQNNLKPNQVAIMKILDYAAKNVVTIPINLIQTDEKGKYVYIMEANGKGFIAKKKAINIGEVYNGLAEIKLGLQTGEKLITAGFQSIYEGQNIATATK